MITMERAPDRRDVGPMSKAKKLAGKIGGKDYVQDGDREYVLERDWDGARHLPGERVFTQHVTTKEDGYEHESVQRWRGIPVAFGTHDALIAAEAAKREKAAVAMRPAVLNVLDEYPAGRGKTARECMADANDDGAVLRTFAVSGVRRLLVLTPGGKPRTYVRELARVEPIVVGILDGKPVPCALEHKGAVPEAVTMATIAIPACGEHAGLSS